MPLPQPDDVLELAAKLKAARETVAILESRWKAFFTQPADDDDSASSAPTMTFLKPRIIKFLEERPDLSFTLDNISTALMASENSVGPYLSVLTKEGKIERRERGMYGAVRPAAPVPDYADQGITDDDIPF